MTNIGFEQDENKIKLHMSKLPKQLERAKIYDLFLDFFRFYLVYLEEDKHEISIA